MPRDDFILEKVKQDLSNQEDLINEQEKLLALLRSAGLPTAEVQERLERLCTIHVQYLELEASLDPRAATNRARRRMH
jgi:hypothetical protein